MDSPLTSEQHTLIRASETSSPGRLLEMGLFHVRQGRFVEGLTFITLARRRLSPDQAHLAGVLDAFIESHKLYSQAQEELLQASKRFVSADAEQQMQLVALEDLLSLMPEAMKKASHHVDGLLQDTKSNLLLHELGPSSVAFNGNQLSTQLPKITSKDNKGDQSVLPSPSTVSAHLPALYITCFGRFEVKRLGSPVTLCSNRQAQTILRYLVAQPEHCATSETLMTLLWPEDEPEVTQARLHTAICALRRSLNRGYSCEPGSGYIMFKNRAYYLSTDVLIESDVDQFLHYYQTGRQAKEERVAQYEKACSLYSGPFLLEDIYANWSFLQREHLSRVYIEMCKTLTDDYLKVKRYEDAERWATALLKENHCDEATHRKLMQIYAAQGRRSEALQQFQRCERVLNEELSVQPLPETVQVVQMILKSDPSWADAAKI
ncbi:MAG TPA: BTAD domain-containing putative transcriptional regulator [Ktedonobacteraceae bacterium]|nr:BTAD domain-containing putative transcriptional regulator [Ktedonobacteraceae bacterium]